MVNIGIGGGQLRVAMEEARHLQQQGNSSILFEGFPLTHPYKYDDVKVYYKHSIEIPQSIQGHAFPILRELTGQIGILEIPKYFQPDWIICHSLGLIYDALQLKQKFGSKVAVIIHAISYPPSLLNLLERFKIIKKRRLKLSKKLLREVDLVISTSQMTRGFVQRTYDINSDVLYLGCDPAKKIPERRGDFILCAQRMSLRKRVDLAAEIISLIDKDVRVIFAGSRHRTSSAVVSEITKKGLNHEVLFDLDDQTLRNLYLDCRAFLYVNLEPFGMNQMEAAANGAAVVANAGSGASELFDSGVHGYFIKDCSGEPPISDYVKCLEGLLNSERASWRMGRNAWILCKEKYTWDHHVNNMLKLFESHS